LLLFSVNVLLPKYRLMKYFLCIYARYDKVIEMLDYSKDTYGPFEEHTLLIIPFDESRQIYVVTDKKEIRTLLKDGFRCKEIKEDDLIKIIFNLKKLPKQMGCQSLVGINA